MTNFDYVEVPKPQVSGFDLSYSNKITMDIGDLVPVYKQEVLPGDEFKVNSNFMVRFAPLANPIYTKLDAQIHYFFVPNRILWDGSTRGNDWQTFITGGQTGMETPTAPYVPLDKIYNTMYAQDTTKPADDRVFGRQSLPDYMGIPLITKMDLDEGESGFNSVKINALPFLAYQKIYDDWFRDPNFVNGVFDYYPNLLNGGDLTSQMSPLFTMRKRAWSKDYFTSALPWAQRGPEVHIPVNTGAKFTYLAGSTDTSLVKNAYAVNLGSTYDNVTTPNNFSGVGMKLNETALGTIRELRQASALQQWLERNAIGGGRYIEQLLSHFGVFSDDARLQRAEYLGSVKAPVVISEVQSNAATADAELGELAGKGVSYGNDFAFNEKFKEHGWIIGVMSVKPEASYCQGLDRALTTRETKLDYAFPEFAEIGLQEIELKEIYGKSLIDGEGGDTFGYNERYGEYKMNYNQIHGYFADQDDVRSQYNMTRFFGSAPILNGNFVEINEKSLNNPFVDTTTDAGNLWVDVWNDVKAVRPLPKHSVPLFN